LTPLISSDSSKASQCGARIVSRDEAGKKGTMNHNANSMQHYGIVISTQMPHKQTCIILDYKFGLIEAVFFRQPLMQRVHHGMLIEYSLKEQGKKYKIDMINVLALPQKWATEDIEFFHAVLRIISQCMMLGSFNQPLFSLIIQLYRHHITPEEQTSHEHELFKKWFLCRLYSLVDIYPDNHSSFDVSFFNLIVSQNALLLPKDNNFELLLNLNRWLESCKI